MRAQMRTPRTIRRTELAGATAVQVLLVTLRRSASLFVRLPLMYVSPRLGGLARRTSLPS